MSRNDHNTPKSKLFRSGNALKWLRTANRSKFGEGSEVTIRRVASDCKFQNLLRLQINSIGQTCAISSNSMDGILLEEKSGWKPRLLKFLRSAKVAPLPVHQNSCGSPHSTLGTCEVSDIADENTTEDAQVSDQCQEVATSESLHNEVARLIEAKVAEMARTCNPVDHSLSGPLCSITDSKLMSTTAHLLSLLDPEDIKTFHKNTTEISYVTPYSPCKTASSGTKITKIQVLSSPVTFQTLGHNGNKLIEDILISKGWLHLPNVPTSDVKCLWVENLIKFNIWDFKEGQQMLNHIPNTYLLSNKLCLLRCLQEYDALPRRGIGLKMNDFVPETYRLDLKQDRRLYCKKHKAGELWICKPAMLNQGKGIFLVRSTEELKLQLKRVETEEKSKTHFSKPTNVRIIQRYISNPLLLDGRKADIRAYMLIASTKPYVVFFHDGYVRLSCSQYDFSSSDLLTHLTNQCMQRKNPQYESMKEETVWDMNRLNKYLGGHVLSGVWHSSERSGVRSVLRNQMCRIMLYCFNAVKTKLDRRLGLFELLGFDFLIDSSLNVWLLEINVNPSLQVNCQVLRKTIPAVLGESVDICYECFEKSRQGQRILPLQSKKDFVLLYCEEMPYMKTIPKSSPSPLLFRKRNFPTIPHCLETKEYD